MIAIVVKGSPLSSGFFVDADEASALVLFSRYFGLADVFVFDSVTRDRGDRLEYYNIKKYLSKKQLSNFLNKIGAVSSCRTNTGQASTDYPQEKIF